jgi:hypothetical protein
MPAGPLNVTVPTANPPPKIETGERVKLVKTAGLIVNDAVWKVLPWLAMIATVLGLCTAVVSIVKLAVVEPASTVTDEG